MSSRIVKGFNDFVGADALKRAKIRKVIQNEFELYGFEPVESPIIESEDFVVGDNVNDEAVRDVFRLEDRGKRKLALRFEFTFQLKRLARNQKLPFKRFQIGSVFRDEPIRKGRSREFTQCDADIIGSSLKDDVECLKIAKNVFEELNMPIKIYVNNRKLINEILVSENVEEKNREQVIREIDKLDKLSKKQVADNLKKLGCEGVLKIFTGDEKKLEKYNFYKEIKELKKLCKMYDIKVLFRPFLARGLSYYNGTVFEVWSDELGVSLAGGGSYLVDGIQATGISFGFEPISLLANVEGDAVDVLVLSLDEDKISIDLAEKLRGEGFSTLLMMDKSVSKGMEYANARGVGKVIFVGKDEVETGKFKVKDMESGKEELVSESELFDIGEENSCSCC
ncbi:MAG: ATP phosphoribosyltransferase regulatory subunit [Nanoarchaeota archaeon]|nr:ATP phosphoribosyltransferase regulatory subunit [Nanoarchaeota archaeon]